MSSATMHVPPIAGADVVLRDGTTVHVRPVGPQDAGAVRAFLAGLSEESRYLRFFGYPDLEQAVRWAVDCDGVRRFGLVAVAGVAGQVIAHGAWQRERDHPERAEVAMAIADAWQGRGLGTILLGQLAEAAERAGVTQFVAEMLPQNHRMVQVFRDSGFPVTLRALPGVLLAELPTSLTPEALERFERREQTASVAAVQAVLRPRSVAVIGASRDRATVGGALFHNLLAAGFNGPVYPVNPAAGVVQSVVAYPSVGDIPGPVDLAVVAVPAEAVATVARECAATGVRALVVVSAGFAEAGPAGAERQRELVRVCRQAGMRLVGPNCLGVVNTAPDVCLDATFGPTVPVRGRVGFLSQSGGLGLAIIEHANALGLGLSSFVSVGNKADISGNDLLAWWAQDPGTDLVLLYLESFGNPRRFVRLARELGRSKPIVAVKAGRSVAGARASASHTGALLAASDVTVEALFRQAGVIRTDTLKELFDVAKLLANQPLPAGRRVGIVTNVGGPGIMCADACEASGLEVPPLHPPLRSKLAGFLPAAASTVNPVDLLASAPASHYRQTIELLAASGEVDAVIAIFIQPLATEQTAVASAICQAATAAAGPRGVPVLAVLMSAAAGVGGSPAELCGGDGDRTVPCYTFPEDAARALARVAEHGAWRHAPQGKVPKLAGIRSDEAAAVLATALAAGGPAEASGTPEAAPPAGVPSAPPSRWLEPEEAARLLACYGLPLAPMRVARTPQEAASAAAELGGPVALKAVAPGLLHKTEAHAVRLGLDDPGAVATAAQAMAQAVAAAGHPVDRFLVQAMAPAGVELLVGVVHDPAFGPVVACGAGGVTAELQKDVAVRLAPLTDRDAATMLRELATFPLLDGYRGAPRADVAAVEDLLLRVSALADTHPEILELDCNPVVVSPGGAVIVDARIRVGVPPPHPLLGARTASG